MGKEEKMTKLERQLRLYEVLLPYEIAELSMISEVFPYNRRMLQRDLADLRDAGLVGVKYSRKGNGYVKTGIPPFKEDATPRRKAHLKKLNRLGRLMSELVNEDIPLWEKKDNQGMAVHRNILPRRILTKQCFLDCRSGRGKETLKCCAGLAIRSFITMPITVFLITRMIFVSGG